MEKQKIGITGRKDNGNNKQRREAYYTAIPSICHRHKRYGDQIEYEQEYGPIPDGAFVALRSDWYKKWPDIDAVSGIDEEGKENAPGWSLEALEYIYKVRNQ